MATANPFGSKQIEMPPIPSAKKVIVNIEPPKEYEEIEKVKEVYSTSLTPKMKILAQYGGLESNVPVNHGYWKMR